MYEFKRFKSGEFDISVKERSGHLAIVEKDELRKDGKKWKILRLIYIIVFFCNKKISKNW